MYSLQTYVKHYNVHINLRILQMHFEQLKDARIVMQ